MFQTKTPDWGKRIQRAIDLAEEHPGTAEVLAFYGRILDFQKTLYDEICSRPVIAPDIASPFREQLDVDTATKHLPALLSVVQRSGPSKLAQEAGKVGSTTTPEQRRQMLHDFLADGNDAGPGSWFARVLFQPQAEYLAASPAAAPAGSSGPVCPVCEARPQVTVLHPEGHGAKRSLVCSFCLTEWEFLRILCPVCGEEDHAKLPRYAAGGGRVVRVEACDTCKYYLKGVDMTVDGLAVPLVDEIATLPLDLWAAEQGYTKISLNLMGF